MTFNKQYKREQCQTVIVETPRGRTTGCEHHPQQVWGWKSRFVMHKKAKTKDPTENGKKFAKNRRRIERMQESRMMKEEMLEVCEL